MITDKAALMKNKKEQDTMYLVPLPTSKVSKFFDVLLEFYSNFI
jgi:hypothetical protein